MTAAAFFGEHLCDCGRWVHEHPERCGMDEAGECSHQPALCCPDCLCDSFYQAHPEQRGVFP